MARTTLTVDLSAIAANWRALDALGPQTAATLKADAYGTGLGPVARTLAAAGARSFFVALAEEGAALRAILGPGPEIAVYSGHMAGDAPLLRDADLIAMLNAPEQVTRHLSQTPDLSFGVQLDTGMNRLGMEAADWARLAPTLLGRGPALVMSHLACADAPDHPMNAAQLAEFRRMTDGLGLRRSLSATGGILLGRDYHFDLTRPGIGLHGAAPFTAGRAALHLALPVIQTRPLAVGETVGYGNSWTAARPTRLATVSAGYADGIHRVLSNRIRLWHGDTPCPVVGRVSMDLITVDITDLPDTPATLDLLGPHQGVDDLAEAAGTIGYEMLTGLGARYARVHVGGA
ncbi:alanine racemase [Rhodobaculum claviforme]|uniref:Alanine racemase n=1 Tax=Rhodobaculum claviforme TaxID=1549854 RepID=A0A934TND2_9RHOB|nr:alanine racemase [Rhodobaculum claviforme]MBK5928751.1 alanine racemase [Rhodobaculum claviforme]